MLGTQEKLKIKLAVFWINHDSVITVGNPFPFLLGTLLLNHHMGNLHYEDYPYESQQLFIINIIRLLWNTYGQPLYIIYNLIINIMHLQVHKHHNIQT